MLLNEQRDIALYETIEEVWDDQIAGWAGVLRALRRADHCLALELAREGYQLAHIRREQARRGMFRPVSVHEQSRRMPSGDPPEAA